MTEITTTDVADAKPSAAAAARTVRKFLVVVDSTDECHTALRFAVRRAMHTNGGVTLLHVLEPADFQHWAAVENLMRQEARDEAEATLQRLADEVFKISSIMPELVILEGKVKDQIMRTIEDDPCIGVLVLGAGTGREGPGPLVTHLAGEISGSLPIPLTIVPGNLTDDQVDELT